MSALKIMQLSSEKSWRGGEQQIAYLILYLRAQNIEVVVCSRKGSAFSKWCANNHIKYYELGFKNGLDIKTALSIKRLAHDEQVDLINSHSGMAHSIVYLAFKFGLKTPLVVHRRVDFTLKSGGFSLAKYNHKNVKAIICVSNAIAKLVREKIDNPEKARLVYSGIDPSRFSHKSATGYIHKAFNIDSSKKLIANISAISPHKDFKTFLKTARLVCDTRQDCHFLIVGDGPLEKEMKGLCTALGLDSVVSFTGFRNDIPDVFREISIFLFTSVTEGLGTTVIDALYNGVPVVATRAGGVPELVSDGINGFLCSVGDAKCLADKLNILLDSDEKRNEMSDSAREQAQNFSKVQMGEGVLKIYKEILG